MVGLLQSQRQAYEFVVLDSPPATSAPMPLPSLDKSTASWSSLVLRVPGVGP